MLNWNFELNECELTTKITIGAEKIFCGRMLLPRTSKMKCEFFDSLNWLVKLAG